MYARLDPGAKDEDIVRRPIVAATAVTTVRIKLEGAMTVEYGGPGGMRQATVRP
jgi:hypothetical protein